MPATDTHHASAAHSDVTTRAMTSKELGGFDGHGRAQIGATETKTGHGSRKGAPASRETRRREQGVARAGSRSAVHAQELCDPPSREGERWARNGIGLGLHREEATGAQRRARLPRLWRSKGRGAAVLGRARTVSAPGSSMAGERDLAGRRAPEKELGSCAVEQKRVMEGRCRGARG
jgi:hypothetical protein